jgi:plasmid stability protein
MVDGELTLKLDNDTVRRLQVAADAVGVSIEDHATDLLVAQLDALEAH